MHLRNLRPLIIAALLLSGCGTSETPMADGDSDAPAALDAGPSTDAFTLLPDAPVTFSEDDQDIVISSRPRGSHGKGVRAITRAAFNLALLRLCARDSRPFPGVVLIDSPLVVCREPDTDEGAFPHDVKDAFYEAVAGAFGDVQVIILENDDPPDSVRATANVVAFTGTNQGRRGFIPQAAGVA